MKSLKQMAARVFQALSRGTRSKAARCVCGADELEKRWMLFGGGVVAVSVENTSTFEGNAGATTYSANFPVKLSDPALVDVTVTWATEDNTAVAGVDYTASAGTLTIPAGDTVGTISVPIIGNRVQQPDRTFFVTLGRAVGAEIGRDFAVGKIVDDDPATVWVEAVTSTASEAQGTTGVFRFSRTGPADEALKVFYRIEGTAKNVIDYTKIEQSVLIPAGKASVDVNIKPTQDNVREGTESVVLRVKKRQTYIVHKVAKLATVEIVDGDGTAPTAALAASSLTAGGGKTYRFTVKYTDDQRMDATSVADGNIQVTGPNKYSPLAELVSKSVSRNKRVVTAVYEVPAPSGVWGTTANGTYTVKVVANQVRDAAGNAMAAGTLGTFLVQIA